VSNPTASILTPQRSPTCAAIRSRARSPLPPATPNSSAMIRAMPRVRACPAPCSTPHRYAGRRAHTGSDLLNAKKAAFSQSYSCSPIWYRDGSGSGAGFARHARPARRMVRREDFNIACPYGVYEGCSMIASAFEIASVSRSSRSSSTSPRTPDDTADHAARATHAHESAVRRACRR
jgi:hypothetical protein